MKSRLGTTLIVVLLLVGIGGMIYLNYQLFNPTTTDESDLVFEDQKPSKDDSTTLQVTPTMVKEAQILYQNDFSDPKSLSDFSIVDTGDKDKPSKWEIKSGSFIQSSNIWGGTFGQPVMDKSFLGTMAILKGKTFQDFEYSVTLKPADDDGMGIVFRADANNFYRFLVVQDTKNGGPFALLQKVIYKDGKLTYTALKKTDWKYETATPYTFKVVAQGSSLQGSINGSEIFAVTDATLTTGSIGIYSYGEEGLTITTMLIKEVLGGTNTPDKVASTDTTSAVTNIVSQDTESTASSTKVTGTIKSMNEGGLITLTDSTTGKERHIQIISSTTIHQNTATGIKASLSDLKAGKTIEIKGASYTPILATDDVTELFIGERIILK